MRRTLQEVVTKMAYSLEIVLSIILAAALIISTFFLLRDLTAFLSADKDSDRLLQVFMGRTMAIAIGVELIKMFSKPSPDTVIEVLLFAIARQMVVEHPTIFEFLLGIVAVSLLFAIRKFLFHSLDDVKRPMSS